ncbi:phosphoribosyl-ATP diphosphatase [Inconstantimicrobium mannanitabidum]|uniref:Phosphoribosyl-ATP pyrophosphatase n=1 Tax=Inconstantimicrobium mannanitabidum TaxID=1604901 RepID=A0ACB5RCR6_9CLOT|nr:phosphoribosyl-ATP diphosphatase [Clostridium sp. TW13]GKX66942.1 phosphoribosyl-ATP pyrophosphatase [Clostridium sp. TW13]
MDSVLEGLYEIIKQRKDNPEEGSYTSYLFNKGLDKILKKVGEESTEVIIASKNADSKETVLEICDLAYHILVMMAEQGISLDEVKKELEVRRNKTGNLKSERKAVENL